MPSENAKKLLAELPECKDVWEIFLNLVEVPRGSRNPTHIIPYFKKFCEDRKLDYDIDEADNVIIRIPATEGLEDKPTICLQGHWDIVNQKDDDLEIDFKNDPLVPRIVEKDGKKWLMATGTSLGADDGIGLAMALSVCLDKDLKHGPLEVLITRDEEIGLIGASMLKPGTLKSKYLINIDSEDYGILTISCAGGFNSEFRMNAEFEDLPDDYTRIEVILRGFHGGHSGVEIGKSYLNTIKVMARLLRKVFCCDCARLISIDGGSAHNAIPRDCRAKIGVPKDKVEIVKQKLNEEFECVKRIAEHTDPSGEMRIEDLTCSCKAVSNEASKRFITFISQLPSGVIRMSPDVEGLVESSFSEGIVKTDMEKKEFYVLGSGRSSIDSELDCIYEGNSFLAKTLGVTPSPMIGRYGAWPVNTESLLKDVTIQAWKDVVGTDIKVEAIHAGLECGCIIKTHPEIDAVSVGPTVVMPHSPSEGLLIDTVVPTYKVIERVVTKLSE